MLANKLALFSKRSETWPTWDGLLDGLPVQFEPGSATAIARISSCKVSTDVTFIVYQYNSTLKAVIVTTSGNVVTVGTAITIASVVPTGVTCATMDSGRVMVSYIDNSTSFVRAVIISVSGTTLTANTILTVDSSATADANSSSLVFLNTNRCLLVFGLSGVLNAVTLTGSSTTITAHSVLNTFATGTVEAACAVTLDTSHVLVTYGIQSTTNARACVLSISTDTITAPTADIQFSALRTAATFLTVASFDATHAVCAFQETATTNGIAYAFSISGTTITVGSKATFDSNAGATISTTGPSITCIDSITSFVTYRNTNVYGVVMTISGTTLTAYTRVNIMTSSGNSQRSVVALDSNRVLTSLGNASSPSAGVSKVSAIT